MENFLLFISSLVVFVIGYITGGLYYYHTLKNTTNVDQHIHYGDKVEYIDEFLFYPSVDVISFPMHVIYNNKRYNVHVFNEDIKNGKIVYDLVRIPTINNDMKGFIDENRIYLTQEQIDNLKNEGR